MWGESLAISVTVSKTGTVCTAAGAHVSSAPVLAVVKTRADGRPKASSDKVAEAAAAAQKKVVRVAAAEARAAATAEALRAREQAEENGLLHLADNRAAARRDARPLRLRAAIANQRTLDRAA